MKSAAFTVTIDADPTAAGVNDMADGSPRRAWPGWQEHAP